MGVLDVLRRWVGPPFEVEHPELGTLRSRDRRTWSGQISLVGPRVPVQLMLDGDPEGPSAHACGQVEELRDRWTELMASTVAEELLEADRIFDGETWRIVDNVYDEYDPSHARFRTGVHVHYRMYGETSEDEPVPVSLSHLEVFFWKADNPEHQVVIHIVDWEGQGYGIDADQP